MTTRSTSRIVHWRRERKDGSVDFHFEYGDQKLSGNVLPASDADGLQEAFEQYVGVVLPPPNCEARSSRQVPGLGTREGDDVVVTLPSGRQRIGRVLHWFGTGRADVRVEGEVHNYPKSWIAGVERSTGVDSLAQEAGPRRANDRPHGHQEQESR